MEGPPPEGRALSGSAAPICLPVESTLPKAETLIEEIKKMLDKKNGFGQSRIDSAMPSGGRASKGVTTCLWIWATYGQHMGNMVSVIDCVLRIMSTALLDLAWPLIEPRARSRCCCAVCLLKEASGGEYENRTGVGNLLLSLVKQQHLL